MHIEKEKHTEAVQKIGHDMRIHKEYKNEDIDPTRTHLNYHFNEVNPLKKFETRKKEIFIYGKNGKHKDEINYLCSLCCHYPHKCQVSEDIFFMALDEVLTDMFGAKNKISSYVHMDEKRSHMHFKFMPIVYNEKTKREELCCKKVINREMLQKLHNEVEDRLFKKLGVKINLHNEESLNHNYIENIDDYKKYKDIQRKILQDIEDMQDYLKRLEVYKDSKNDELRRILKDLEEKRNELSNIFDSGSLDDVLRGYSNFGRE